MTREQLNAVAAQLKTKLANHKRAVADVVPDGWFTSKELSKTLGIHFRSVNKLMLKIDANRKSFRIVMNGKLVNVPHYHL